MTRSRKYLVAYTVLCAALAGCNVGLDPRRFERIEYGVESRRIESLLEEEPVPQLVFFDSRGDRGPVTWRVDRYDARHPHPDYFVITRDGVLASVVSRNGIGDSLFDVNGWKREDLEAMATRWVADRLPLAWSELEPIDTSEHTGEMHPTTYAIALTPIALPGLAVMPVALLLSPMMDSWIGDAAERRAELVAAIEEADQATTSTDFLQRLGPPDRRWTVDLDGDLPIEVQAWRARHKQSIAPGIRVGFEDDRVLWMSYRGPGYQAYSEPSVERR